MKKIYDLLFNNFGQKYEFLRLYDVSYDTSQMECVITFLYPHDKEISDDDRSQIKKALCDNIRINGNIKIKFKKSFLDSNLIKKEILDFVAKNFKAIWTYLTPNQITINNQQEQIEIIFSLASEIKKFFDISNVGQLLNSYLCEKFIASFNIKSVIDKNIIIPDEIEEVEIPVLKEKNPRYEVFVVKELFGGNIIPSPEFIKNNNQAKNDVILAGNISQFQKKSFMRKKGKKAGEEGYYYSFLLNDGKKIECIYFSTKTNIPKMDLLADGMTILCLGDIKRGLGDKLTYYIKKISLATINEESKNLKEVKDLIKKRRNVVLPEDFIEMKQSDFFTIAPTYSEFINNNNFVVYDLETTGIDSVSDSIIEIGAVKIVNGKVTQKFSTFVNPQRPIPQEASRVNNITDEMVADAPVINDVIHDFMSFIDGCVLMGYNNINFDNKFIFKVLKDLGIDFKNETMDVYNIVRNSQIKPKNFKLTSVAKYLGVDLEGAHRAYNDAYATAQIFLKLNEIKNN